MGTAGKLTGSGIWKPDKDSPAKKKKLSPEAVSPETWLPHSRDICPCSLRGLGLLCFSMRIGVTFPRNLGKF